MVKKYIVELESGTHIFVLGPEGITHIGEPDVVYETVDGMQIGDAVINAKPYTEPDLEQVRKEAYQKGYETGYEDGYNEPGKNQEEVYQRGLSDAWEAAKKLWDLKGEMIKAFRKYSVFDILNCYTAAEVIEKLKQYEQEKEEKQHTWICSEAGEPSTDITLICSKCGYTITIKPGDTQALNFCPKCGDNKRGERDE